MAITKHAEERAYRAVKEGIFEIDAQGRIWRRKIRKYNRRTGEVHVLSCERRRAEYKSEGYLKVVTHYDGRRVCACAHRLVWLHFNGPIPGNKEINHKDGIKDRNRPDNLELMTHAENITHAIDVLGRHIGQRGADHWRSTITTAQVLEIRRRRAAGDKLAAIALDFDIDCSTVSKIARKLRRAYS